MKKIPVTLALATLFFSCSKKKGGGGDDDDPAPGPGGAPTATITGAPVVRTLAKTLDVTVGGEGVETYRYKLVDATAACAAAEAYSAAQPVANKIADDISTKAVGKAVVLCVVGAGAGGSQAEASATTATFKRVEATTFHASYVETGTELYHYYLRKTDAVAKPVLVQRLSVGGELADSMQLDADGVPVVALRRGDGRLFAFRSAADAWAIPFNEDDNGELAELAFAKDGVGRIASFHGTDGIRVYKIQTTKPYETVFVEYAPSSISYLIASDDTEYVVTGGNESTAAGRLGFSKRAADGTWSDLGVAGSATDCNSAMVADAALDGNNALHVAYFCRQKSPAACQLRYTSSPAGGGSWTDVLVEVAFDKTCPDVDDKGLTRPSIAVDADAMPHIVYSAAVGGKALTRYASKGADGKFQVEVVDPEATAAEAARPRVVVDKGNDAHVFYQKTEVEVGHAFGLFGGWQRESLVIVTGASVAVGDVVIDGVKARGNLPVK